MKILIVDDESYLTSELKEFFSLKNSGMKVVTSNTISDALSKVSLSKFDALLIDVNLPITRRDIKVEPQRAGIWLKDQIITQYTRNERPYIFLFTANTQLSPEELANTDGIFHKPIRPSYILKSIMEILQ